MTHIYAQPNIRPYVERASVPVDGPIMEIDPTFSSLRARYPDPKALVRRDMDEL